MKKSLAGLLVVFLLAGLALGLAGCGSQGSTDSGAQQTIKVAMDASYKPFEFRDEQNKIIGFDADLINAIGQQAGLKVQMEDTAWDGIIPALLNGKVDLIASAMTITEERKKSVQFSDPYFTSGQAIAVPVGDTATKGVADLKGKVIGVQLNTTGDIAATEKAKDAKEIKRYNVIPDAFVGLENGEVQAVVADAPVALAYLKANPGKVRVLDKYLTEEQFGFAIKKENKDLADKVNQALKALHENGKYDEIYTKWFGKKQ